MSAGTRIELDPTSVVVPAVTPPPENGTEQKTDLIAQQSLHLGTEGIRRERWTKSLLVTAVISINVALGDMVILGILGAKLPLWVQVAMLVIPSAIFILSAGRYAQLKKQERTLFEGA